MFEKHLLETYLAEHQTDPVTNEPATVEDYVELKGKFLLSTDLIIVPEIARPRPANLTSLPSLLSVFQTEWDAIALETFTLRKQLLETRQELSTALYQHDAACRVIVRLQKERDEAREALSKVSIDNTKPEAMDVDSQTLVLPVPLSEAIAKFKDEYHSPLIFYLYFNIFLQCSRKTKKKKVANKLYHHRCSSRNPLSLSW